ncbi:MAG: HAD family hydrolase, partial [Verrucomicrobiota bacterium]|nr:HAD family hydrolase [Verrucomicrobiota bacterium]
CRFVELVRERAGPELDPERLRAEFQRRLDEAIARRIAKIRTGAVPPCAYLVHGAREFLEHVARAGLTPVILSTTIQNRLSEEAELLGIAHHFGPHVYGGTGDPLRFSKRAVFERLRREEGVIGERLLSVGDGPIETRDTKDLGGIAIAVCSDEERNGSGVLDRRKRDQLFAAGADAAIPDFRAAASLLDFLLGR